MLRLVILAPFYEELMKERVLCSYFLQVVSRPTQKTSGWLPWKRYLAKGQLQEMDDGTSREICEILI
jgi:hypothetical protein